MAVLELAFESKEESLSVRQFYVRDGLSSLFEVSVVALSRVTGLDLESFIGKTAAFLMMGGPLAGPRAWSGICSHFELVQAEATGLSTYHVRIVPQMYLLRLRKRNRIFQHLTIPVIVQKILAEYSIKAKLSLVEPHGEHEYRVQYGESDFDFVNRLLEEEGISYYFAQVGEGYGYTTEVVLTDKPEARGARPAIPFVQNPNQDARKEFVRNVRISRRVKQGAHVFREFDFTRPDYQLLGEAERVKGQEAFYEHYRYAPSALIKDRREAPRTPTGEEAKLAADIGLQAARRGQREVAFEANTYDLGPGMVFSIDKHPRKDVEQKTLLVTEVLIEGSHDSEWNLSGSAAFTDVRFRPMQVTPKPIVDGVESAIIVGQKGEEIHTDEHGRVRVQFHWDRDGQYDEHASCWVRVAQGWGGGAFGMITLPRVGHEVLVGFLEGDPDLPIILGRAYNKTAPVPFKLGDQKTVSTWKSQSSPKAEGWNEITFDDAASKELLYIQAQRNLSKLVKANETERTGANRTMIVGANRTSIIGAIDSVTVGERWVLAPVPPKEFDETGEPVVQPKTTMVEMVNPKVSLTTGKGTGILDDANITIKADQNVVVQSGGDVIVEGRHVYINTKSVAGNAPQVNAGASDGTRKLAGRTLGAVVAVFGQPKNVAQRLAMQRMVIGFRPPTPHERIIAGKSGTSMAQMIARRKVALDFYKRNALVYDRVLGRVRPYELPTEMRQLMSHLTGIDFKQPVVTGPPPPPPGELTQWQAPGGRKGNYFAPTGTTPLSLGIGEDAALRDKDGKIIGVTKKIVQSYAIPGGTPYIRTIASDKTDTWSVDNTRQRTRGGGVQYYMPDNARIEEKLPAP